MQVGFTSREAQYVPQEPHSSLALSRVHPLRVNVTGLALPAWEPQRATHPHSSSSAAGHTQDDISDRDPFVVRPP